jgi:hypothetical protein
MRHTSILSSLLCLGVLFCLSMQPSLAESEGIGWIPTWKQAIAEAAKSHKPILLVAAAPACSGVSGVW